MDDFNLADTPLMSGVDRDAAIRSSLRRRGLKAAGFVAGKYVDAEISPRLLTAWSQEGHILGNHSFSHNYYGGHDPIGEMADILKCEPLLKPYSGFRKLFRFPFLAEGNTAQGRDNLRAMLRACGYSNGHVTIDTSDWYIDQRLTTRLKSNTAADIAPYRAYWLDHIWDLATYYDGLARAVLGRSIDPTILLHHRLTTALFLRDGLEMFRRRGWRLTDAATAFAQPDLPADYDREPQRRYPVLYVTDADYSFPLVKQISHRLNGEGAKIKDFILVGLSYAKGDDPMTSRRRDYTPTAKGPPDAPPHAGFGGGMAYQAYLRIRSSRL